MRCAWRKLASADGASPSASATAPLGVRDDRVQHRALVLRREPAQLEACRPRFLDLARGECDLDLRGEQRRSLERVRDLGIRPADRRERGVALPLREPKLREARLGLTAVPARIPIRLFGRREFAAQPQQLALPVEREPGSGVLRLDEALGREPCLLERLRP